MNDSPFTVDVLDPDWRSFESVMQRREHFFASMLRLDELCRQLSQQAHEEYERRRTSEPAIDRQKAEDRARVLKEAVVRALASTDPTETEQLWLAVDRMLD